METIHHRNYGTIPIGIAVRRQLAHTYIYRVRHGNGFYNSKAGAIYQDRYDYVVPSSINNAEGQAARNALAAAVANWQGFTSTQKKVFNDRAAAARMRMSGYNLYVREYVRQNA